MIVHELTTLSCKLRQLSKNTSGYLSNKKICELSKMKMPSKFIRGVLCNCLTEISSLVMACSQLQRIVQAY